MSCPHDGSRYATLLPGRMAGRGLAAPQGPHLVRVPCPLRGCRQHGAVGPMVGARQPSSRIDEHPCQLRDRRTQPARAQSNDPWRTVVPAKAIARERYADQIFVDAYFPGNDFRLRCFSPTLKLHGWIDIIMPKSSQIIFNPQPIIDRVERFLSTTPGDAGNRRRLIFFLIFLFMAGIFIELFREDPKRVDLITDFTKTIVWLVGIYVTGSVASKVVGEPHVPDVAGRPNPSPPPENQQHPAVDAHQAPAGKP